MKKPSENTVKEFSLNSEPKKPFHLHSYFNKTANSPSVKTVNIGNKGKSIISSYSSVSCDSISLLPLLTNLLERSAYSLSIINNKISKDNRCWHGCKEKGMLVHYWWEHNWFYLHGKQYGDISTN